MARHLFVVATYALPDQKSEFDRWYVEQHIPDLLQVPGIISASRYTAYSVKMPLGLTTPDSVVIYTIESDDPKAVIAETGRRMGTVAMPSTPALDSQRTIAVIATPAHETPARVTEPAELVAPADKPLFFAATYAKANREQDLFDCYDREHVPDLIDIPGMGKVTRYTVEVVKLPPDVPPPAALLLHEMDPAEPHTVVERVKERSAGGQVRHTDALDGSRSIVFTLIPETSA